MKRTHVDDPPIAAPAWIVSYSDMISLLVTFFVLLVTFSTLDDHEESLLRGAFGSNRGGVIEELARSSLVPRPVEDRMLGAMDATGADRPHARPAEQLTEDLEALGRAQTDAHLAIDFTRTPDGLLVTFSDRAQFAEGAVEPNDELARSLRELAEIAAHYPHVLVVEGQRDASESAELAEQRAAAAARILLADGALSPEVVQLGASDVAASSRRVDVRIVSLDEQLASVLAARGAQR